MIGDVNLEVHGQCYTLEDVERVCAIARQHSFPDGARVHLNQNTKRITLHTLAPRHEETA